MKWTLNVDFFTFDLYLGDRDPIVALCTSLHSGDSLGKKPKRFQQFKSYGEDTKVLLMDRQPNGRTFLFFQIHELFLLFFSFV